MTAARKRLKGRRTTTMMMMTLLGSVLLILLCHLAVAAAAAAAGSANVLNGRKDTAHPYGSVQMDPDSQHVPLALEDAAAGAAAAANGRALLRPPPPRLAATTAADAAIFVGTVSFRDAERCGQTLLTALERAHHRRRIVVAVVDQVFEGDGTCLAAYCRMARERWPEAAGGASENEKDNNTNNSTDLLQEGERCPYRSQIRVDLRHAGESRGPSYARHYRQLLIRDEEFCMQVDSHTVFTNGWDTALIEDWLATENEMGILTTYPHHIWPQMVKPNGDNSRPTDTPHICDVRKGGHGLVRFEGATTIRSLTKPVLTFAWGGGLVFGKCHSERRVRVDPHTRWMFDGEEYLRAALLWTSGYDLYSPTGRGNAIYHNYTAVPALYHHLKVDRETRDRETEMGANRIRLHLGQPFTGRVTTEDLGRYSGSRVRHMDQFLDFSGVVSFDDHGAGPANWTHRCHQLHWVPYEHPEEIEGMLPGWKQGRPDCPQPERPPRDAEDLQAAAPRNDRCDMVVFSAPLISVLFLFSIGILVLSKSSARKRRRANPTKNGGR